MSSWSGRIAFPFQSAYGASKWALEAIAEALSAEVRDFGISVSLLEPGPVSSGALDSPQRFFSDDTYLQAASPERGGVMITPEELATATADAIESDKPALRIPVGAAAVELLTQRRQGDDRLPFAATLTR
jgi:short-subunit dehydrogenase